MQGHSCAGFRTGIDGPVGFSGAHDEQLSRLQDMQGIFNHIVTAALHQPKNLTLVMSMNRLAFKGRITGRKTEIQIFVNATHFNMPHMYHPVGFYHEIERFAMKIR